MCGIFGWIGCWLVAFVTLLVGLVELDVQSVTDMVILKEGTNALIRCIRKTTLEFSHLIVSFCIFSHLIANIRPDKTEPAYCMSYLIKT
jgi:hypothetical protein